MRRKICENLRRLPIVLLCQLLILSPVLAAQPAQRTLKIVIVQGDHAKNVVQQITAKPFIVRIEDAGNRPVAGASVVFTAPQNGPGGTFANESGTISLISGQDGTVDAGPYHPNGIEGSYQIQIRAQFQNDTAIASIAQTNVARKSGHRKLFAVLAITGAAAGAAVAVAVRDRNSNSNTPSITFGGAAVGAPK